MAFKRLFIWSLTPIDRLSFSDLLETASAAIFPFLVSCVGKGHGGLYKAPTKEEGRKQKVKRIKGSDQVY